jgi:hypothetical protein
LTLVVDATVTVTSVGSADGFKALGDEDLVAPALMWSEARSTIHLGLLNGKVSTEHAKRQHEQRGKKAGRDADQGGRDGHVGGRARHDRCRTDLRCRWAG